MPTNGGAVAVENPGGANTQAIVTIGGYTILIPIGVCASFLAFQNWVANNSVAPVPPSSDQTGWADLFSTVGVTQGN